MRCEDCLAVVEEYFDGELEPKQTERVSTHLAACADCAAALDALSFEQDIYLRYERDVEVTPALWQNVKAGVARLEATEQAAPPPPARLARLRGRLAASLSALTPRAAFAPTLALLVLGVALGSLWLARRPADRPSGEVALQPAREARPGAPAAPPNVPTVTPAIDEGVGKPAESNQPAPVRAAASRDDSTGVMIVNAGGVNTASAPARRAPAAPVFAPPPPPDHLQAAEQQLLPAAVAEAPAEDDVVAAAGVRLLDPEEKEIARHLEQAQALLRTFQNEAPETDAVQFAYERRLSRRLLEENAALQLGAETAGRDENKQVLDTLEPFLLDIANLRDNASRDEVRSIKERMRKREIIAALTVY